jgi:hypothetical protein
MMPIPHSGQIIIASQLSEIEVSALNLPTLCREVGELSELGPPHLKWSFVSVESLNKS